MGRLSKKLVSIVTTVVVASTVFGQAATVSAGDTTNKQNLEVTGESNAEKVKAASDISVDDGVMLHAWNWSFKNIKDNIKEIADAGYTAIQTSPAQDCRLGANWDSAELSQTNDKPSWYYLYQPTYFNVGNKYLGSEDDFKAMCSEARNYGIKIVVDVVANHLADVGTDHQGKVDQDLLKEARKCSGATDPNRIQPGDWTNREKVTQGCCIGMPDNNTKGEVAQKKIGDYLANLVKDGADGFRFDAAKSIELPAAYETETGSTNSDFWTKVLGEAQAADTNKKLFSYGEILQSDEPGTNAPGYIASNLMRITASNYSQILRYSVGYDVWQEEKDGKDVICGEGTKSGAGEVSVKVPAVDANLISESVGGSWNFYKATNEDKGGQYTLPENKAVGYFETHDLYANAGATRAMSKDQREVCWSILTARKDIVPLFFNRPKDIDYGSNMYHPQGEAYNTMGEKGSDDFKSNNVAIMNRFHTSMQGEDEKLEGINANVVYKATRGSKGVLLANVSSSDQKIDTETTLPDGAKVYSSKDGSSLTVSGGKITGTLKPLSFVALSTVDLSKSDVVTPDPEVKTPTIKVASGDNALTDGGKADFTDKATLKVSLTDAQSATYKFADGTETVIKDGDSITIDKVGDLVITAKNGDKTASFKFSYTKAGEDPVVNDPAISAQLDGEEIKDAESKEITDTAKLKLSFKDAKDVSYVIDKNDKVDLTDDDVKNGKEIELGKDLEAGKSQTITVTAVNGDKTKTFTYTVNKKASSQDEVLKPEISAKYNDSLVDENKVCEFKEDEASIVVSLKNAESASYSIDDSKDSTTISDGGKITIGKDAKVGQTIKVAITAKNSKGDTVTKTYNFKKVSKETPVDDKLTFDTATADKTSITLGDSVNITCDAKSSKGDKVEYTLKYSLNGDKDTDESNSNFKVSDNVIKWTPDDSGTYKVTITAKCNDNVLSKTIENVVVNDKINDLSASLKNEDKSITLGDSMKLIADVANASGTPKYKFQYHKVGENKTDGTEQWYKLTDFSEANNTVFQPQNAGTYQLVVLVQDDNHKDNNYVVSKKVIVTVAEKQDQKPATGTQGGNAPSGDATKTLPVIGTLLASAIVLAKKFKKQR